MQLVKETISTTRHTRKRHKGVTKELVNREEERKNITKRKKNRQPKEKGRREKLSASDRREREKEEKWEIEAFVFQVSDKQTEILHRKRKRKRRRTTKQIHTTKQKIASLVSLSRKNKTKILSIFIEFRQKNEQKAFRIAISFSSSHLIQILNFFLKRKLWSLGFDLGGGSWMRDPSTGFKRWCDGRHCSRTSRRRSGYLVQSNRQTGPSRQGHSRGIPFSIPTTSICLLRSRRYLSQPSQMHPGLTRTSLVQPLPAGLLPGSSLLLLYDSSFFYLFFFFFGFEMEAVNGIVLQKEIFVSPVG